MNRFRKLFLVGTTCVGTILGATMVYSTEAKLNDAAQAVNQYQIVLNETNGKLGGAYGDYINVVATTKTGYPIKFGAHEAGIYDANKSEFAQLKKDVGYYYNLSPITNIKKIVVDFESSGNNFEYAVGNDVNPSTFIKVSGATSPYTIDLASSAIDNYFFSIKAGTEITYLKEVTITYSCDTYFDDYKPSNPSESSSETENFNHYFKADQNKYKLNFNDFRKIRGYDCEANQKGNVRSLVIPIEFEDASADMLPAGREGTLKHIQSSIFGDPNVDQSLGFESVSSFYKKSSYGQCNITGKVLDWYKAPYTMKQIDQRGLSGFVSELYEYYSENGLGAAEVGNLSDFDANHDGYVDSLFMIFASHEKMEEVTVFKSHTTQKPNYGEVPQSSNDALFSRYSFVPYDSMYLNSKPGSDASYSDEEIATSVNGCIDSRPFIHQFGHVLGLNDYYSYDNNGDSPLGGLDMMDLGIGDHNAYSKALMGWISPYVVDGNAIIDIKPFEESGDSILVPIRNKNWKENTYHLLDEYLLIQYDTPTGLAEADGKNQYKGVTPLYYNVPGVRVFHVDSRFGAWSFENGKLNFARYLKDPYTDNSMEFINFAHENTKSMTSNNNCLLQLVEPSGKLHVKGNADNSMLWQTGDEIINMSMNSTLSDNAQMMLGYSISVLKITPQGATIKFSVQ